MKTQQTTISEVSLIYKSKVKASDRPQVKCSRDAYILFMEHWNHQPIEHVILVIIIINAFTILLGAFENLPPHKFQFTKPSKNLKRRHLF